jgi:enoyl-CoA hydratase
MANEFEHGLESLRTDAAAGAARFAGGEGRHGAF